MLHGVDADVLRLTSGQDVLTVCRVAQCTETPGSSNKTHVIILSIILCVYSVTDDDGIVTILLLINVTVVFATIGTTTSL